MHTADWHIGKIVNQVHMTEDQEYILNEFVKLISMEKPDVVVISGDLYDRAVPPVEAVDLLDRVFTKILMEFHVPVIAIAGNHDSGDRIEFANHMLRKNGLYIYGKLDNCIEPIRMKDEHGYVNFYAVPYADPAEVRHIMKDENIHTHNDAMKSIIASIEKGMNKNLRNVLIAHGFVAGGQSSDSERPLSIGGTEYIDSSIFKNFNYTALGHLHGPQRIGSDRIRYSGSLLKYSFSEARQKKSISIVNLDECGEVHVERKSLKVKRDMRVLSGKLKDILDPDIYRQGNVEDYICANLTDEGEIIEPMSKLRAVYPNILKLTRESGKSLFENTRMDVDKVYNQKNMLQLFDEFYTGITGKEFTEEKKEVILEVLKYLKKEEGDIYETD
ncbi:exonuclease SbcCD subunit D [Clostridium sp. LBM24168]